MAEPSGCVFEGLSANVIIDRCDPEREKERAGRLLRALLLRKSAEVGGPAAVALSLFLFASLSLSLWLMKFRLAPRKTREKRT